MPNNTNHTLEEILHPQSIAITGASNNPANQGYNYTRHLQSYGFRGKIYPVNPKYPEILGLKCYPSLKDIPGTIDYVISCVPAGEVIGMLDECSQKGVKGVGLFTARFSETGHADAAELEQAVLRRARQWGIRLIGPNGMGLYYPREGISFAYDFPTEPGSVGLASQTGGGSATFVPLAALRGIRYSKVFSYGNALDFNECDYLEYFSQDPETKVILMYVEGVKDGKRFFNVLRNATKTKPVGILKGGRGKSGVRAVASHTASLAGSMKVWETLISQAGAIFVQDFDEMVDLAVSFYFLPKILGASVAIGGGGGGPSVLAADVSEEAGLDVIPLPAEIHEELRARGNPMWDWIGNPADLSILGGSISSTELFSMMARNPNFDLLMAILHEPTLSTRESMASRRREEIK